MISIVIPLYNEKGNIRELYNQIVGVIGLMSESWELIFVDDGSSDGSIEEIRGLSNGDKRVKAMRFSRNFGQYAAVRSGIDHASGDAIIVMDADLQEPPLLIPKLIAAWKSGYKAVYTIAVKRNDSLLRKLLGGLFYRTFGQVIRFGDVRNVSEMRLIDRVVGDAFRSLREKPRFIKGMFFWLGFRHTFVEYEKQKRKSGESKYSVFKLIRLALDGIFSFSSLPVRFIRGSGYGALLLSVVVAILTPFLFSERNPQSVLVFLVMFIGSWVLIALGILGEYMSRIYDEVRGRPHYIVEEYIHLGNLPRQ